MEQAANFSATLNANQVYMAKEMKTPSNILSPCAQGKTKLLCSGVGSIFILGGGGGAAAVVVGRHS